MANDVFNYDDTNLEPAQALEAIPAGKYQVVLVDCSDKTPTRAGTGFYLKFTFEVISGEYKGRKIFQSYNLWHTNSQTQEIARREVKALKVAVGLPDAKNPQELFNLPCTAKVKLIPAEGEYDAKNEIKGFTPKESPSYGGAANPGSAATAAPAAAPTTPPWQRGK